MILFPLKEKTPAAPKDPAALPAVAGPECLGRVLEHGNVVLGAGGQDAVVVGALTVEVDGDHGGGPPAVAGPAGQLLGHQVRVDGPGGRVGVDQHRPGSDVGDDVGGGHEGLGGHEDVVARLDAEEQQPQVQGGGPAREGQGGGHVDPLRHVLLEAVHMGAEGGDPIGVEGVEQEPALLLADIGWGQEDATHGSSAGFGTRTPAPAPAPSRARATRTAATTAGTALRGTATSRATTPQIKATPM